MRKPMMLVVLLAVAAVALSPLAGATPIGAHCEKVPDDRGEAYCIKVDQEADAACFDVAETLGLRCVCPTLPE